MAELSARCEIAEISGIQRSYTSTVVELQSPTDGSYAFAGYFWDYSTHYYKACIVRFTTPKFLGVSKSIKFDFTSGVFNGHSSDGKDIPLRYALTASTANKNSYVQGSGKVEDGYQIEGGIIYFVDCSVDGVVQGQDQTLTIKTKNLQSETEYYLIFWAATDDYNYSGLGDFSASLDYVPTTVRVGTGDGFEQYRVYVGNGEDWDQCTPYVGNGAGWDMCN